MKCHELKRRLTEFGEGALTDDLCAEVERHLNDCDPCETLRQELLALSRMCRRCPPPHLPDDVRERIARLLRES